MQNMFACTYEGCKKSYCSAFNLKRHVEASHLGIRKFNCEVCGKSLSSKQNYIDHQFTHTGEKPYVCEFPDCGACFRQMSQYFIHLQMHEKASNVSKGKGQKKCILNLLGKRLAEKRKDEDIILTQNESTVLKEVGESRKFPEGWGPAI
jgi:hypothetical protein